MVKYRIYIMAVMYMVILLFVFVIFNSRGCYTHSSTNDVIAELSPNEFYLYAKNTPPELLSAGDIILHVTPGDPDNVKPLRIIAAPGDILEIKNGVCFINGEQEDHKTEIKSKGSMQPIAIPEKMFYVLPDKRERGLVYDNRSHFINHNMIKGRILKSFFGDEAL